MLVCQNVKILTLQWKFLRVNVLFFLQEKLTKIINSELFQPMREGKGNALDKRHP